MKNEGYLFVDHRASPGLPESFARNLGLDPKLCGEGKVCEAATLTCLHCRAPVVMNPERKRNRGNCWQCGGYICDTCAVIAKQPGYVHRSWNQLVATILEKGIRDV